VAEYSQPGPLDWRGRVVIKRLNVTGTLVRTPQKPLQRNGGKVLLLVCPICVVPRPQGLVTAF
jgi:hypothetical protein